MTTKAELIERRNSLKELCRVQNRFIMDLLGKLEKLTDEFNEAVQKNTSGVVLNELERARDRTVVLLDEKLDLVMEICGLKERINKALSWIEKAKSGDPGSYRDLTNILNGKKRNGTRKV